MHIVSLSYDRFPAPKGAATHIAAFATALAEAFGEVDLVTVQPLPEHEGWPLTLGEGVRHQPLEALGATVIDRVLHFRQQMLAWWGSRKADVLHFRSIYEGYPLACRKAEVCRKLVFEVNGLPSVELKYTYPAAADDRELQRKLIAQEDVCLSAADLVLTVSEVNANYLRQRGVEAHRLRVIPNGVHLEPFAYQPPAAWQTDEGADREIKLLYAGSMSSWQGVPQAIEALALYRRDFPARLLLAGEARPKQRKELEAFIWQQGVRPFVDWCGAVTQRELVALHHACHAVLAPLRPNDRNQLQGCCPLKVLEAMACGTPLVASDLPVVLELARRDVDALLVRPGSPKAIKDALLRFRESPALRHAVSLSGRRRVERQFTWHHAQAALVQAYEEVLGCKRRNTSAKTFCSTAG